MSEGKVHEPLGELDRFCAAQRRVAEKAVVDKRAADVALLIDIVVTSLRADFGQVHLIPCDYISDAFSGPITSEARRMFSFNKLKVECCPRGWWCCYVTLRWE